MKEFLRNLLISFFVALFFLIFSQTIPNPTLYHYYSLLLGLLIFCYVLSGIAKSYNWIVRKSRKVFPKVGIFNGHINTAVREYKCKHPWTNITPEMWERELKNTVKLWRLRIKMISISEMNDSFYIIVNPFGDNFPEESTKLHSSFYRICNYIARGGIFVVTGGAFFHHQNTLNSEKCEAVIVRTVDGGQSLKDTLFYQEFGVMTTGDTDEGAEPTETEVFQEEHDKMLFGNVLGGIKRIKRFRATCRESSNFIPIIREEDNGSFPMAYIRYGCGYLLHGGMHLEKENSSEFKLMINAIKNLVIKRKP